MVETGNTQQPLCSSWRTGASQSVAGGGVTVLGTATPSWSLLEELAAEPRKSLRFDLPPTVRAVACGLSVCAPLTVEEQC